jgi:hypothetical protein
MEKLKSFEEFLNEKKNDVTNTDNIVENNKSTVKSLLDFTFESETGDFTLNVNEGFVKDLQEHIRKTMDILIGEYGIKSSKLDKHLERNLLPLTTSFQNGDSPEETAKKIA